MSNLIVGKEKVKVNIFWGGRPSYYCGNEGKGDEMAFGVGGVLLWD
jgi:hypothetical protein